MYHSTLGEFSYGYVEQLARKFVTNLVNEQS